MTYQQAAQTALDVQDASNLSGVAKSLAGPVLDALWTEARARQHGTDWINQHPIVTLFLDKLTSLNRKKDMVLGEGAFSRAYDAVSEIAAPAALEKVERI